MTDREKIYRLIDEFCQKELGACFCHEILDKFAGHILEGIGTAERDTEAPTNTNELKPCPQCREVPTIGYACGDFFIRTSKPVGTCFCGSFVEMHSSPEREAEAWNRHVEVINKAMRNDELDALVYAFRAQIAHALKIPPDVFGNPPSKK